MKEMRYILAKVRSKFSNKPKEVMSTYFRRAGMKIGQNCNICCNILTTEPYLIEIGDNVTISGGVHLVTHDNSISKVDSSKTDVFGRIRIGNDCFIGQNSVVLYGVTLGDCIIVGSGSVVTKSFYEKGIIIGGNPAKKIGTWDSFCKKNNSFSINVNGLSNEKRKEMILLHLVER